MIFTSVIISWSSKETRSIRICLKALRSILNNCFGVELPFYSVSLRTMFVWLCVRAYFWLYHVTMIVPTNTLELITFSRSFLGINSAEWALLTASSLATSNLLCCAWNMVDQSRDVQEECTLLRVLFSQLNQNYCVKDIQLVFNRLKDCHEMYLISIH